MDSTLSNSDLQNEEFEAKVQELFTAHRTIERLNVNVEHLEQENEYLKNALAEEKNMLEEAKKNEGKSKNDELHRQMIAELRQALDESQESGEALREEKLRLEKRLQQVLENSVANTTLDTDLDTEEILALNSQVSMLQEEKTNLQAELLEMSMKFQRQAEEKIRLQHEISEKEEELECMENQFATQCDISERLREENQLLKSQLESEMGQVDVARKGNSLFSEVDDRRVAAESKVVQIHQQMKNLEEKLMQEQKENKRLKNQIAFLRQSLKKGFDEDTVKGLQEQLLQSKKTISDLTEKLGKLESSQKPHHVIEYPKPAGSSTDDKQYVTFLEGLIRSKTKEISEVKSQAHKSHLQTVRTDLHLTQANNELQLLRNEVLQLKQCNSHLAMTLQDLQHKYGESSSEVSSPSRRRQSSSSSSSNKTTAAFLPSPKHDRSSVKGQIVLKSSRDASAKGSLLGKENVRLRDLVNLTSIERSPDKHTKSKGVQLSQDVKVLTSDGDQSTEGLRQDGKAGKMKRVKGSKGGKFDSVTYETVPEDKPSECNQQ
ncbi:protein spindly [Plakobranchus ocellatus]|uniref:Protein spindly n=1 Tax=Plakobranchus ocellatus TaxID=259542 RepID=A0AAV4CNV9_9GAST|nr:protein spindly [Plakobranchus ocellatus]